MSSSVSADELLREDVRGEAREVADGLALADELDGQAGLLLYSEHEAALRRSVELREHEPRDPAVLDERLRLRQAVLTGGRVEHEQHLADRRLLLDDPLDLAELVHEPALGVQATGGVDDDDLGAVALGLLDRLEGDGCRILALALGTHDAHARALGPRRELVDGRSTERVGRAHHDAPVVTAEEPRELTDRRGLAHAVDADDEHDRGPLGELQRRVVLREPLLDELAEHPLHVARVGGVVAIDLRPDGLDDLVGDPWTEVGADERGLEVVPRVLVDGLRAEDPAEGRAERPGCTLFHVLSLPWLQPGARTRYTDSAAARKGLPVRAAAR